jgi:hypothetical protein
MSNKKTGVELIAQERQEQLLKHKFTLEHDKEEFEKHGDVLGSAIKYLLTGWDEHWPKPWERYWKERLDEKTEVEKLAVVGALVAAKIDLLQNL